MKPATSPSALKVQAALGETFQVLEFDATTRTAADAAAAIGCTVGQIAKSLIFRSAGSNRPVLVVASGVNRVDETKVAEAVGEGIARADAEFVREATGFAIGGVPPVGHKTPPTVLIDESLMAFAEIWAASPAFESFRGEDWMPEPCRSCERRQVDFGGCRCQAFMLTGDARNADQVCHLSPHHGLVTAAHREALALASPEESYRYRRLREAPAS